MPIPIDAHEPADDRYVSSPSAFELMALFHRAAWSGDAAPARTVRDNGAGPSDVLRSLVRLHIVLGCPGIPITIQDGIGVIRPDAP